MLDLGGESVDEVLCDPKLAAEFDRVAADFAPGHSPLQYRWAALKIAQGGEAGSRASADSRAGSIQSAAVIGQDRLDHAAESPGSIRSRLRAGNGCMWRGDQLAFAVDGAVSTRGAAGVATVAGDPEVSVFAADLRPLDLLGCRSKAVREHKPRLNVLEPDGV